MKNCFSRLDRRSFAIRGAISLVLLAAITLLGFTSQSVADTTDAGQRPALALTPVLLTHNSDSQSAGSAPIVMGVINQIAAPVDPPAGLQGECSLEPSSDEPPSRPRDPGTWTGGAKCRSH